MQDIREIMKEKYSLKFEKPEYLSLEFLKIMQKHLKEKGCKDMHYKPSTHYAHYVYTDKHDVEKFERIERIEINNKNSNNSILKVEELNKYKMSDIKLISIMDCNVFTIDLFRGGVKWQKILELQ